MKVLDAENREIVVGSVVTRQGDNRAWIVDELASDAVLLRERDAHRLPLRKLSRLRRTFPLRAYRCPDLLLLDSETTKGSDDGC